MIIVKLQKRKHKLAHATKQYCGELYTCQYNLVVHDPIKRKYEYQCTLYDEIVKLDKNYPVRCKKCLECEVKK
jgi:hypothetical protein